ncbi:DHA2 family efflux MFS transporter permease subunit [Jatrophihabitans telluris]|uniref:DHA2 family efflux MFS transporter permease subunit n=1 Tax=Jatrophihabitans telluris TaxID=2038343 RepID=A0ABY4R0V5_9ACTN|nr:DHA2 family efflux MFS transporter permease subunit [Jatrophihabitans telluris]UQX88756.1 DHA2 family efflux MFS transporter permease subunit [Jatrophihabitans telluris]
MTTTEEASGGAAGQRSYKAAHPALVLLIIAGAQLMIVLDGTIVNIALPKMGEYFGKDQTSMTWAINAYTLAFGGLLLLGGRAGDILGRRRMFMVGLGLFTVGSFLAGLAHSFEFLIFGRVIQGIGGAIASPTALSLITTEFEEGKERTRAFAVFSAVAGAGAALGLLLGGVLTEYLTWRWVLFVNVPIGVALVAGAWVFLHESDRLSGRFDWFGGALSTVGMASLVYGFIHAASNGWRNGITVSAFVLALVLLISFVVLQSRLSYAMMPLRALRNRDRSGAYIVMLIIGAAMFGMFFFVTYFVQLVLGYSALKSGLAFLPVAFTIGIAAQISAALMPRVGPRNLILFGSVLMTGGLFWLATITPESTYLGHLLPSLIVMAFGIGSIFVPLTTVAVAGVEPHEAGLASALLNVGQQVGGSIGLSVLTTVFATASKHEGVHQAGLLQAKVAAGQAQPSVLQHFGELSKQATGGAKASLGALHDSLAGRAFQAVLAHGSARGFLTAAILALFGVLVTAAMIRVGRSEVENVDPAALAVH